VLAADIIVMANLADIAGKPALERSYKDARIRRM
jgi:hypothetical protein